MILTPVVFGLKHLTGSLFIVSVVFGLLFVLRKGNNPTRVLKVSALFIIALEVIKYLYVAHEQGALPEYMFPLNLCSYSLYAMPLVAFGSNKTRHWFMPFAYAVGMLASLIVFIYPATVLGTQTFWFPYEGDFLPYHSFAYHGVMLFFSLYLITSKTYVPRFRDVFRALLVLIIASTFSGLVNLYLKTDFMFLYRGNGNPLQFLIATHYMVYLMAMVLLGLILLGLTFMPFMKGDNRHVTQPGT